MKKQIEWTLGNGAKATYTVAEQSNEIIQSMNVSGFGSITRGNSFVAGGDGVVLQILFTFLTTWLIIY